MPHALADASHPDTRDGARAAAAAAVRAAPDAHPSLWRMTRRSVPRGVAVGLFVAVIIPFMHTVIAALLGDPDARQCRGRRGVHAGGQSADDPANVLCRLSDRVVGAAPRLEAGGSGRGRTILERAQPAAVLGSPCVRTDRARNPHHGGDRPRRSATSSASLVWGFWSRSRWRQRRQARKADVTVRRTFGA